MLKTKVTIYKDGKIKIQITEIYRTKGRRLCSSRWEFNDGWSLKDSRYREHAYLESGSIYSPEWTHRHPHQTRFEEIFLIPYVKVVDNTSLQRLAWEMNGLLSLKLVELITTNTIYAVLIQTNNNQHIKRKAYVCLYVQTTYAFFHCFAEIRTLFHKNLSQSILILTAIIYLCRSIRDIKKSPSCRIICQFWCSQHELTAENQLLL